MAKTKDFSVATPRIGRVPRAKWNMPFNNKLTFDVGKLVPFYLTEVLPGDTFKNHTSMVVRLSTPLTTTMDNLELDVYYFYTPSRILWAGWKHLMGESRGHWFDEEEIPAPHLTLEQLAGDTPNGDFPLESIPDYFGLPVEFAFEDLTGDNGEFSINTLPFRAYKMIWNEWFRDQNLQDPVFLDINSDSGILDILGEDGQILKPLSANKYHDYFTSALPSPQKGPTVFIPFDKMILPVVSMRDEHSGMGPDDTTYVKAGTEGGALTNNSYLGVSDGVNGTVSSGASDGEFDYSSELPINFINLWANSEAGPSSLGAPSINALRLAFQIQKVYETDARSGSRYIEMIRAHFDVISPDSRQQRPEYLGGKKIPINIQQVAQLTPTTESPLGTVGAFSYTADSDFMYQKSFTEHGYIMGLVVARYKHSYENRVDKMWRRRDRFDYYLPSFAHLGEQPVMTTEIYCGNDVSVNDVFGYQEAWADYRFKPNQITGRFRSILGAGRTINQWHYGDTYTEKPTLSEEWIKEDKSNVERTLTLKSEGEGATFPNIIADVHTVDEVTRVMPVESIPGLIDHF